METSRLETFSDGVPAFGGGLICAIAGLLMCALPAVYFALPTQYRRWVGL